jgi:hypothetical protein
LAIPTPSQILEQIRSHYLTRLRQGIADHAGDGIVTVVPEAALRGHDGKLLRRGTPLAPVRVDLVTLVNERVRDGMEIESETMPGFPPFSLRWKHVLPVVINPFAWNLCPVRMVQAGGGIEPITDWFEQWFDADELKTPGEDGLIGVVHSIRSLAGEAGSVHFSIDLGSAPIEAFEEMIEAMFKCEAVSAEIGTAPAKNT